MGNRELWGGRLTRCRRRVVPARECHRVHGIDDPPLPSSLGHSAPFDRMVRGGFRNGFRCGNSSGARLNVSIARRVEDATAKWAAESRNTNRPRRVVRHFRDRDCIGAVRVPRPCRSNLRRSHAPSRPVGFDQPVGQSSHLFIRGNRRDHGLPLGRRPASIKRNPSGHARLDRMVRGGHRPIVWYTTLGFLVAAMALALAVPLPQSVLPAIIATFGGLGLAVSVAAEAPPSRVRFVSAILLATAASFAALPAMLFGILTTVAPLLRVIPWELRVYGFTVGFSFGLMPVVWAAAF